MQGASASASQRGGCLPLPNKDSAEGAEEAAKRYLMTRHMAANAVQLRLLRKRVVMTAQKTHTDVLLRRLHRALPRCTGRVL
jgi:hypothetical protein